MANVLYPQARRGFLEGQIFWLTANIKAVLVDTGLYAPNFATDTYLGDIPPAALVATSPNFTGKTSTDGVADANDLVFVTVVGPTIEALVIYMDMGVPAVSPLIAFLDTVLGLPVTPTGFDVFVTWSNGPFKIFKL